MTERTLTPKQQRFADEFLTDLNGAAAYRRVYGTSGHSAEVCASELLRKPHVAAYISTRSRQMAQKLEIKAERVLQELARIAFGDTRSYYNADGSQKRITELDDAAAAAVASFDESPDGTTKIKTHDKIRALEMLAKHKGLFEKDNEQKGDGLKELLALVQNRTTGLAGLGGRPILPVQHIEVKTEPETGT